MRLSSFLATAPEDQIAFEQANQFSFLLMHQRNDSHTSRHQRPSLSITAQQVNLTLFGHNWEFDILAAHKK